MSNCSTAKWLAKVHAFYNGQGGTRIEERSAKTLLVRSCYQIIKQMNKSHGYEQKRLGESAR